MPQKPTPPSKVHRQSKAPSKASSTGSSGKKQQKHLPTQAQSSSRTTSSTNTTTLSPLTQQSLLSHFTATLSLTPPSLPTLQSTIQRVKTHLYARDFSTAFGSEIFLRAYAARWSPARALGYAQFFVAERDVLGLGLGLCSAARGEREGERELGEVNVLCLGGGAGAELVGVTAAIGLLAKMQGECSGLEPRLGLRLHLVDSAPWEPILNLLSNGLDSFLPESAVLERRFLQLDVLSAEPQVKNELSGLLATADLVTMFFTLNELYASGLSTTTKFLLELGEHVRVGTKVCVVDSAGSYAGVTLENGGGGGSSEDAKDAEMGVGKDQTVASKQYPMAWMLDHTLLELASRDWKGAGPVWKKLLTDESRWFRRDKSCEYPLQLEDMRYQVHVFERM